MLKTPARLLTVRTMRGPTFYDCVGCFPPTQKEFYYETKRSDALEVCCHQVTHQCQSKTLSSPDFESTYTNKASLEVLAVC